MNKVEDQTIDVFSKRSDRTVMWITCGFALGGAFADLASHSSSAILGGRVSVGMLWGIWIPLCCLLIPLVHHLCRQVVVLRERLEALEKRMELEDSRNTSHGQ